MNSWKMLAIATAVSATSGCGAGIYGPSANHLAKSMDSMATVASSSLQQFPSIARGAMMESAGPLPQNVPTPQALLCNPVRYVTYTTVLNRDLQGVAGDLVLVSGASARDFPGLVAAMATPYTIGPVNAQGGVDTPQERATVAARGAARVCEHDLGPEALTEARDAFLAPMGDATLESAPAPVAAGITMWRLMEPILSGGLRFFDQQRRSAAIRRYLRDDRNEEALETAIDHLRAHVGLQQDYRRRLAAASFAQLHRESSPGGFTVEERGKLLEAASLYDTVSRASGDAAFAGVRDALDRIVRVAEGQPRPEDFAEAMRQLASSVEDFHKVASQWESLEEGGANHAKWMAALRRLGLAAAESE